MTTLAPSARSSSAVADPRPPAPPTRTIESPSTGNLRRLRHAARRRHAHRLQRDVAKAAHPQEHREHLAVAQVVFEEAFGKDAQEHGDGAVQNKARLGIEAAGA